MKKLTSYLPSLILSVLLVFACLASALSIVLVLGVNEKKAVSMTENKNVSEKIITQLDRNFRERQNATGIPAKVYMDQLDKAYIQSVVEAYIKEGFSCLGNNEKFLPEIPKNAGLESAIDKFFNDYADEIGYEKDEVFYSKLENTKSSAYKTIGTACDVYKFGSLSSNGVIGKLSRLYKLRSVLTAVSVVGTVILLLILFAVNFREKAAVLYWAGVSFAVSGIIGTVPTAYLISTKYFNAFSIKQPQVFAAYTGAMFKLTGNLMTASIMLLSAGIILFIAYGVIAKRSKKPQPEVKTDDEKTPDETSSSENK